MSHASRVSKPGVRYPPVFDGRKRRIRGVCQRSSSWVARRTTDALDGRKKRVWHVLEAAHQAKNAEVRHVDFNPALAALLTAMKTRCAPDPQWLFPSPQGGNRDIHAQTFRESLKPARQAIQMPNLGFHDTRHAFISRAVMAGIDFMTIARWLGHKDGGVLIGKVYGHIANEHRQKMAARLQPAVEVAPQEATNSEVPRAQGEYATPWIAGAWPSNRLL